MILTLCLAAFVLGHEGKIHIMATITELSASQVTIKSVGGKTTTILLTKNTKHLKGEKGESGASFSDMEVGQRVVIDIAEQGRKATATEIRLSSQGMEHGIKHTTPNH